MAGCCRETIGSASWSVLAYFTDRVLAWSRVISALALQLKQLRSQQRAVRRISFIFLLLEAASRSCCTPAGLARQRTGDVSVRTPSRLLSGGQSSRGIAGAT